MSMKKLRKAVNNYCLLYIKDGNSINFITLFALQTLNFRVWTIGDFSD